MNDIQTINDTITESFTTADGRPSVRLLIPGVVEGNLTSDAALKLAALLVHGARFAEFGAETTHRVNPSDATWLRTVVALGGSVLTEAGRQIEDKLKNN